MSEMKNEILRIRNISIKKLLFSIVLLCLSFIGYTQDIGVTGEFLASTIEVGETSMFNITFNNNSFTTSVDSGEAFITIDFPLNGDYTVPSSPLDTPGGAKFDWTLIGNTWVGQVNQTIDPFEAVLIVFPTEGVNITNGTVSLLNVDLTVGSDPNPVNNNASPSLAITAILPVTYSSFIGNKSDDCSMVVTEWVVESEINNQGFEIQRSFNGLDFETIGFIEGKGTNASTSRYEYVDYLTSTNSDKDIYYRLKQIDIDGNFDISKTIFVSGKCKSIIDVSIYPNPARNILNISMTGFEEDIVIVKFYDQTGKFILEQAVETNNRSDFDINELKPGIYNMRIHTRDQIISKRFIKID